MITAVHNHHLSWQDADAGGRLLKFRMALRAHRKVFTTNYDLLAYWAIMNSGAPPGEGFGDLFWNASCTFDPLDTTPHGDKTLVYWLHGGLHLYRGPGGETVKQTSDGATLLDRFGTRIPLFVSEGTPDQKRAAIRRSDYLEHAFAALAGTDSNIVVFGHALGRSDEHIVRALRESRGRRVAYGVDPTTRRRTELDQAQVAAKLPETKITFFDSRTHPLGDPALLVP